MNKYQEIFEQLGLSKNEGRIYETLLSEGELGVGDISAKSGVHRRNVYDSLHRLIEKGLTFERITSTEHRYQATDPKKLQELIQEKQDRLQAVMPALETMYNATPHEDDVVVYRGIEGWKNYLRDLMQVGEDVYTIGAKGTWQDERLNHVRTQLSKTAKEKDMRMYWLFDPACKDMPQQFLDQGFTVEHRYLPDGFNTNTAIDIYGDRVVIITDPTPGEIVEDMSFTVLINQHTADSFRTWHGVLWKACKE